MQAKPEEKREARRLRSEQGLSIKQIAARLGVSAASAHAWTADIKLSAEQQLRNLEAAQAARSEKWRERNRERRRRYQQEGRAAARRGVRLHHAGCMLYWAEGAKARNSVTFANSDLHMVRIFRRLLSECFGVRPERFAVSLNVYTTNGLSVRGVEDHWLKALELPKSCLRKHMVNHFPTSSSGGKPSRLPYGVCALRVHDTRIVQHIYGAIQEYAGFEEPRWLDGPPRKPPGN